MNAELAALTEGDHYAIDIEWDRPGLPSLVGPFGTRKDAFEWGETNIVNGIWEIRPLARPYYRIPPASSEGSDHA